MFENLNAVKTVRDGIDLTDMPFTKLKEYAGQVLHVDGFFFTDGDYGRQVVVVANDAKINMPARAVAQFEKIKNDPAMLSAMLDGKLIIKDIQERAARKGKTTGYTLADAE